MPPAAADTREPAMSDTPALPLFFSKVVGVNPAQHAALRLDRATGYRFAAAAASIPLGLGEFTVVARHYPIVFAAGPVPAPVALVGINDLGNLFIGPDGAWRADAYVPAYVRAYPFLFVEDPARNTTYVAMDETAACLATGQGAMLFEDGKPTAALGEAVQFCSTLRDNLTAAAALGTALDAAGLLQEEEATVNFTAGGSTRVRGFKVIRADRLDRWPTTPSWIGAAAAGWARSMPTSTPPAAGPG